MHGKIMNHKYGFAGFCGSVPIDYSKYSDILAFHIRSDNHKFQTIIQISFNDTTIKAQTKFE